MPRARDPARDKAREIWEASGRSLKLRDIAEKLQVLEATVRAWKSLDEWESKDDLSVKNNDFNAKKRNRGGQPGNTNGKGSPGRTNAAVTGAYMRIYDSLLTDDEKELMAAITDQNIQRRASLNQHLAIQHVRELRLLRDINEIRNGAEQLTRRTVSQIEPSGKKAPDGRETTKVVKISQEQETRREMLLRFEDALTRVQAEIRRTEDSLRQLDEAEAKLIVTETTQSLIDAMTAAYDKRGGGGDG